jgi:SAM-dependent methyltransferase
VVRFAGLVPAGGQILDLACGAGRHTRFFLDRGHPVTGIDIDLTDVGDLAAKPEVELIGADLERGADWPPGDRRFAGVVVTNYLHRPLLPNVIRAVAPGGALIYESFAVGNERFGRPRSPLFLLKPGELLEAVRGQLEVVAYECGEIAEPRPAMVQRIAAVRR